MKVWLTELAELDLKAIADRIVERNPSRALSFVVELRDCCARIGELPHAGPRRPQWGDGVRIAIHGKYLVVYRVHADMVQVLRIVHGARDLNALFADEPLPP